MSNIITLPRSRKNIISLANIIRKIANAPKGCFDVIKFIEHTCYDIIGLEIEILDDNDSELAINEYAKYIPSSNCIKVRQSVYNGAAEGVGKDRFTLAHELGHSLMHREMALYRSDRIPKAFEDPEWQANEFAANVLCPLDEIKNMDIYNISNKYNVSFEVAQNQLEKLRRIKYYEYTNKNSQQ